MNYLEAINFGDKQLKSKNIKSFGLDCELLLAKVLNHTREELLINLNKKIEKKNFNHFKELLFRRKSHQPIAQLINLKEFWKNNFFINKDVLVPRPETELILEEILKITDISSSKNILDIGTGSGCIIISILKERPNCFATAIDISKKALKVAKYNAKIHHLENKIKFIKIDIDNFNHNKYDFIVSNPPYIKKLSIKRLEKDVKFFEPHIALEAGFDGFREIKKLIIKSKKLLKKNGKLIFEIGEDQLKKSKRILTENGFYINKISSDIYFNPRVIISTNLN